MGWAGLPCVLLILILACRCRTCVVVLITISFGVTAPVGVQDDVDCQHDGDHGLPGSLLVYFMLDRALISGVFVLFFGSAFCIVLPSVVCFTCEYPVSYTHLTLPTKRIV